MEPTELNRIAGIIVDCAYQIHKRYGPALFESAYRKMMVASLIKRGLMVECEKSVHIVYDEMLIADAYRIDLLVEDEVIVELKAIPVMRQEFERQILTYLELADKPLGYLINFGGLFIKEGIHRYKNGYW